MTADSWILLSPILFCAVVYFLIAWSTAIVSTLRLLCRRRRNLPALAGGKWLRWGWTLTLSSGCFLSYDLPHLLRRIDFFAVTENETAHAVAVIMALIYAALALLVGATLFLLSALEARNDKQTQR